ncbi:MAG TPA: glycine zipper 2TM domain-containing protein [Rhodocyclaceae bacterium]|jgi:outer membrane lipoprotein SlyB|nr:glycine zipper 2TM domain-containing protein [Rhodocyclaceae bacterium]
MSNLIVGNNDQALLKEKAMNIKPKILYPSLIVAAFSVTLLSLTGVAALTGYLPGASAKQESSQGDMPRKGTPADDKTAALCASCGTVESVRLVERKGSGSGLGAVAGGVAGALIGNQFGGGSGRTVMTIAGAGGGAYAGNEIEKNMNKSSAYQIKVRMADGSMRTLSQREVPHVNSGDRVRISNGVIAEVL